jgi:GT2 family glycosyltransferase
MAEHSTLTPRVITGLIAARVWKRINSLTRLSDTTAKALRMMRRDGVAELLRRAFVISTVERDYPKWILAHDRLTDADRAAIRAQVAQWTDAPLLSVVMPVYNAPERWLRAAIASVREQLYPHWELCIADDCSPAPHVRPLLEAAAAQDARIRVTFRTANGGIAAASNSALALARGTHVGLLDHDDALAEQALYLVAAAVRGQPGLDFLYSDEDKLDEEGRRCLPYFKPDWNPDLLLNQNYVTHFAVYRRTLLERIGGFRQGFDGGQDFDLALRFTEQTEPARIGHLPFVLYHWRMVPGSTAQAVSNKSYTLVAAKRAMEDALRRRCAAATVEPGLLPIFFRVAYSIPAPAPLVSLIVPTRDKVRLLRTCIESVLARTTYPRFEIVVVDNQSAEGATLAYFERLRGDPRVRIVPWAHPFNYAALNNFAAAEARGELLCLLNNDIEVLTPDWLTELVGHALRPEVGAAGARLLYPDGTLQHAGIFLGYKGSAGHLFKHIPAQYPTMGLRTFVAQNVSGVTAACLVLRKAVYAEAGGLDERYAVAFNDVDFCLRIRERGYRIVWTPYATLTHHESASRGREDTPLQAARLGQERDKLRARWARELDADPAYNPNLTLDREDCGLAEAPRVAHPWAVHGK